MGRESFDDTELGGGNLSAGLVDDCPHVCTNHPYTADESCGIKDEAYLSCTLIISMGWERGRDGAPPSLSSSRRTAGRLLQFAVSVLRFGHVNLRQHTATAAPATPSPLRKRGERQATRIAAPPFYDAGRSTEPEDGYITTAGERDECGVTLQDGSL